MSVYTIGSMRLEEVTLSEGLGFHLWRGSEHCGYFREEIEGKRAAVALSMLTDAQWQQAVRFLIDQADRVLEAA